MSDDYEITERDIAIVGMAARVPGAKTPAELWANLVGGVESIRRYTDDELLAAGESPELLRHPRYVRAGAPLDGMPLFDGEFFGFSPKESAILDPQHRHFLECTYEALENAAHPPERFGKPIGVFAGCGMGSYFYFHVCSRQELVRDVGMFLLRHTGNDKDFLATRASYLLDLHGPSVNVQTACSTSLVATHLAVQSLLARECDMAIAGGVTIELPHGRGYVHHEGEVLSPDGHCHAFDHRGQGTVFGSGVGVVVLRRLADALDDGDVIHAVIRGTATNNDGSRKVNYLAPSVDGQATCMVEAFAVADVDPRTIDYVECHGTGTALGDPIEVEALTQAFRTRTDARGFCAIGSIKTNLGHLDTAAGVVGLIKTALALKHARIPPSLQFEKPNPAIDFASSPFRVATELRAWPAPANHPRRAAVNSLGVGGTNAHVVLQEPPGLPDPEPSKRAVQLLTISARTRTSLEAQTARLAAHLEANPDLSLADVAYTLHHGRRAFAERRAVPAADLAQAIARLRGAEPQRVATHAAIRGRAEGGRPKLAFLLPGGGAHYARMALDLYRDEPVFREHAEHGFELLRTKHGIDLRPLLAPDDAGFAQAAAELDARMDRQLPAILITSVAIARLFAHHGVVPDVLLGHSAGENTAAHLAGVMSFEDTLGLVMLRAELFQRTEPGAMLSVALSEDALRRILPPSLDLAAVNGPSACVVSGSPDEIAVFEAALAARGDVETQRLAIPVAAHSRRLDPILPRFEEHLRRLVLRPPTTPIVSNLTGRVLTDAEATDPAYWTRHLRSTVRFAAGVETLLADGPCVLVEAGPGRALSSLARQHPEFRAGGHQAFASMRHADEAVSDVDHFLGCLGRLWATGAISDLASVWKDELRSRVELPTYAWDHKPYFIERTEAEAAGARRSLRRLGDVREFGFVPRWKPTLPDLPIDDAPAAPRTHLLFLDRGGVGLRLREALRSEGHRVVAVHEGDSFHARPDGDFVLAPERGREGYVALIRALVERGETPERIVHLGLLEAETTFRPGSSLFHHHQERGFFGLFFLAQALTEANATAVHLTVIANGVVRTSDGETLAHPQKALVLGPAKVLSRELEGASARLVDVVLPQARKASIGETIRDALARRPNEADPLEPLVAALLDELRATPGDEIVALRGGRRLTQTFVPRALEPLAPGATPPSLRDRGVYLVTGGLGGLGLTVASWLADRARARLVLLGRSPLPPRERWDDFLAQHGPDDRTSRRLLAVRALEAKGAEVRVIAADVTHREELEAALAEVDATFGALHGIFHAAGELDDDLLAMKTPERVERVFAPKVQGTLLLHELTTGRALDVVVLFSSTSTATAPAGQVDYVAANAFLDAFAEGRRAEGANVLSLHWGIWADVGMAAEPARLRSGARAGEPVGRAPTHPWLTARVADGRGGSVLRARFSPLRDWVLDGHRTRTGHALLPGTASLELVRAALRAEGETAAFEIEDLFFVRPFDVPEGTTRTLDVSLVPTARGYAYEARGEVHQGGRRGTVRVAQAHIVPLDATEAPAPIDAAARAAIVARCTLAHRGPDPSGLRTAQEAHLRFGRHWRVLRESWLGGTEGVATLALPADLADETRTLGLHPALLDLATGWAMELIEGYDGGTLYVPVGYERARVFHDLTPELTSWVRTPVKNQADAEFVYFDVTLIAPDGRVLVEVERLGLRRMDGAPDFAQGGRVAPSEVLFDEADERSPSPGETMRDRLLALGLRTDEGMDALGRVLAMAHHADPASPAQVFVSSVDLPTLVVESAIPARAARNEGGLEQARPDLGVEYLAPRDDVERTLVGFWQELLGVDPVGVRDDFFDLGGHSLLAVRLFARIKSTYRVEFPISVLFEAPTIERCAALVRDRLGPLVASDATETEAHAGSIPRRSGTETAPRHRVAMHAGDGGPKTPLFLVAGMFGNVLNLRHLAQLVGTDRRVYGLQARGLYGDEPPHETFEEMGAAYLDEVREVQPHGPYLLGGFSGGGITAYEMAKQLEDRGESVALLLLLDTPVPAKPAALGVRDRFLIQRAELRSKGPTYLAEWAERRAAWELGKLRRRFGGAPQATTNETFHDAAIEAAFRRALDRYRVPTRADATVHLFRPKLPVAYDLGDGRRINHERSYVHEDNGWSPFVREVAITEVPGDHDSMVLEPNVRVLARRLREALAKADAAQRSRR